MTLCAFCRQRPANLPDAYCKECRRAFNELMDDYETVYEGKYPDAVTKKE